MVVICWVLSAAIAAIGIYLFRTMQQPRPDAHHTVEPYDRRLEEVLAATPEPDLMPASPRPEPRAPLFRPRIARGSTPPYGGQVARLQTEPTGEETTETDTVIVDPSVFDDIPMTN